jgi:hypothetical protein
MNWELPKPHPLRRARLILHRDPACDRAGAVEAAMIRFQRRRSRRDILFCNRKLGRWASSHTIKRDMLFHQIRHINARGVRLPHPTAHPCAVDRGTTAKTVAAINAVRRNVSAAIVGKRSSVDIDSIWWTIAR